MHSTELRMGEKKQCVQSRLIPRIICLPKFTINPSNISAYVRYDIILRYEMWAPATSFAHHHMRTVCTTPAERYIVCWPQGTDFSQCTFLFISHVPPGATHTYTQKLPSRETNLCAANKIRGGCINVTRAYNWRALEQIICLNICWLGC